MFEYINGILSTKTLEYVSLDINGLGYLIYIPFKTYEKLNEIGEKQKLYIYTRVKEDDIRFYGFSSITQREVFVKIISINGVGPKIALSILSVYTEAELSSIIENEDYKTLSKVPGLGVKTSQKMILELKGKLDNIERDESGFELNIIKNELKLALDSLGYNKIKIDDYITDDEIKEVKDSGQLMKQILKNINNKR